ncbi:transposase [Dactylosporangium aurantiacum]|uniref:Transposase n=1 Tax=Dactylosporangium aurantiacum TaxID=35754 RepID=A0A9Q9M9L9_9ACTN|nr:transposase [Dactylosporangium aurantiacum]
MLRPRRYPSDLTDEQWALAGPLLPAPKRFGRPEQHPRRSIGDAVLYVVRTGCAWLDTDLMLRRSCGCPWGNGER